jgi:hypothetical protein
MSSLFVKVLSKEHREIQLAAGSEQQAEDSVYISDLGLRIEEKLRGQKTACGIGHLPWRRS